MLQLNAVEAMPVPLLVVADSSPATCVPCAHVPPFETPAGGKGLLSLSEKDPL